MKVCSFLPAATQMIYGMNLQEHLCGVTFECVSDQALQRLKLENRGKKCLIAIFCIFVRY